MRNLNENDDPRALLRELFDAAVERALPRHCVAPALPAPPRGRTRVLGAGKASAAMAQAVDAAWPVDAPLDGLVVTRYGHVPPESLARGARIGIVEAAHPLPDEAGEAAARRIVEATRGLGADDLVLCLVSGGGSSLLSLPAPGIALADKRAIHRALLHSGAPIAEINCVRKHLSAIKGGRLGALCAPARVVTLVISDVPGDDPAVVASGPTIPDPTTCADALAILRRHRIEVPVAVRRGLEDGSLETPKPGDATFANHEVRVIATARASLEAAAAHARRRGFEVRVLGDAIEGESREVGRAQAVLAREIARSAGGAARACVLLSGGETTVTVRSPGGRGGRAAEFVLGCARAREGEPRGHVLAADPDGIDGTEDNAGAFASPTTLARARALGLDAAACLARNDAWSVFAALGDLLVTGPTCTNVNDFRAVLVA